MLLHKSKIKVKSKIKLRLGHSRHIWNRSAAARQKEVIEQAAAPAVASPNLGMHRSRQERGSTHGQ
jgi:hypothetical protein